VPNVRVLILADDALAPVDRLWRDAVDHLARKLGRVVPLDSADVPTSRAAAIAHLDAWAGREAGNWRVEVTRFYDDHIPVYLAAIGPKGKGRDARGDACGGARA